MPYKAFIKKPVFVIGDVPRAEQSNSGITFKEKQDETSQSGRFWVTVFDSLHEPSICKKYNVSELLQASQPHNEVVITIFSII